MNKNQQTELHILADKTISTNNCLLGIDFSVSNIRALPNPSTKPSTMRTLNYTIAITDNHELILSLFTEQQSQQFRMRRTATLSLKTICQMLRTKVYFDFEVTLRAIGGAEFTLGVSYHSQLPEGVPAIKGACLYVAGNYFDLSNLDNYNNCREFINCWYAESKKLDTVAGWSHLDDHLVESTLYCMTRFDISPSRGGYTVMYRTNMQEYIMTDWIAKPAFKLLKQILPLHSINGDKLIGSTMSNDSYKLEVTNRYRNGLNVVITRHGLAYKRGFYQEGACELFIGDEVMTKVSYQMKELEMVYPEEQC